MATVLGIGAFLVAYFWLLRNPLFPVTMMPLTALDRWVGFEPQALPLYLSLWFYVSIAPALLQESGLARPPRMWADVHQTLQSRHARNTFVIGDAAQLPRAVAKQAYNAIDMGELAAVNVTRFLAGSALKPFEPTGKPVLIAFGDLDTYLVAGRTVLASKAFAGAKEGVYQLFMSQMAPCDVLKSLPAAGGRLWQSWRQLAWPQLLSLADFRKLPDRRAVRML